MIEPSMVERVAMAISNGDVSPTDRVLARRAIEAMLAPTPVMRRIGAGFFDDDNATSNDVACLVVYTSMIGAALAGQTPTLSPDHNELSEV